MIATMSEQDGNGHTHDAPCPLCRAQNDARSLLLALASSPALPLDVASALAADSIAAVLSAVRRATAPRAPPILA
jgi:hypothetical protein